MMDLLQFRAATSGDIPAIDRLVNSAYRGESSKKGWTTEADLLDGIRTDEEQLRLLLQTPDTTLLLCSHEDRIIGCVCLQKKGKALYLGMLTVDPNIQAQGLGKRLLDEAEWHARANQCSSIEITVITQRKELIDWYRRRGFAATGDVRPFPDDPKFGLPKEPLQFIVMEKPILV